MDASRTAGFFQIHQVDHDVIRPQLHPRNALCSESSRDTARTVNNT